MFNCAAQLDKIKILAEGNPVASIGARSLFIEGLDPTFEPYRPRSSGAAKDVPPPIAAISSEQVLTYLRSNLFAAIASLNAVQNVT